MFRKTSQAHVSRLGAALVLVTLPWAAHGQPSGAGLGPEQMPEMMRQVPYGYGGWHMGSGMTGGMGMMQVVPYGVLDLSDEQRTKINKIQDALRKEQWDRIGKIMDEQARLRDLFAADEPDAKKIGAVYNAIFQLRRQMIEARIESMNRIRGLLTPEQREKVREWRRGMWYPSGQHAVRPWPDP